MGSLGLADYWFGLRIPRTLAPHNYYYYFLILHHLFLSGEVIEVANSSLFEQLPHTHTLEDLSCPRLDKQMVDNYLKNQQSNNLFIV